MSQWYYAKDGQQHGPVSMEDLRGMIASGALNPARDLVWNQSMTDWVPAAQVPVLTGNAIISEGAYEQPFAYSTGRGQIEEILPGSAPIIGTACIKRGWDLAVRHIGPMIATAVIFLAVSIAVSMVVSIVGSLMGLVGGSSSTSFSTSAGATMTSTAIQSGKGGVMVGFQLFDNVISGLINVFLTLGVKRICLNAVSGKQISVGMLFGQGRLLLRGFGASVLYVLMVIFGLLLFIFPGIYLALRYGQYLAVMVDKDLGIMDSFSQSAKITQNNLVNLFVIYLLSMLVGIAGCLALGVGLLFAYPVIWLAAAVAYRWMQYGGRAILDDPMTGQPLLSSVPE